METGGRGAGGQLLPQILTDLEAIKLSSITAPFPRLSDLPTSLCNKNKTRFQKISCSYTLFFQALRSAALAAPAIEDFEKHEGTHILQSLDGFAIALNSDGRFLYISETVSIYLGLSQVRPPMHT